MYIPKIGNYEVKRSVKINNEVINQIGKYNKDEFVKFVGIHIDKHLTWKEYINIISSKISRAILSYHSIQFNSIRNARYRNDKLVY